MKILHINEKIIACVWDKDWFCFDNQSSNASVFDIDEVDPTNKAICLDLVRACNKVDEAGEGKYILINGELQEKIDWIEKIYDII